MAIHYVDYEGGNNANSGNSFANRVQDIRTGLSGSVSAGDTVRIMATPDETSLGSGTWTNNTTTVVMSSAPDVVELSDGSETWTAATNVTTSNSSSTYRRTNSVFIDPASGFTTGKLAYYALGASTDLSSYEQISMWINFLDDVNHDYRLALCSDTTGDTVVDSFSFHLGVMTAGWWNRLTVTSDGGGGFGSAIQSIALYADSDPGTGDGVRIGMILACLPATTAGCLTLNSVIGKGSANDEHEWYTIQDINGTTITLDGRDDHGDTTPLARTYNGTTESVTTYAIPCATFGWGSTTEQSEQITQGGDATTGIVTYSGGWNRTDMTTQTGETWLFGLGGFYPLETTNLDFAYIDKLNVASGTYSNNYGAIHIGGTNRPRNLRFGKVSFAGGGSDAAFRMTVMPEGRFVVENLKSATVRYTLVYIGSNYSYFSDMEIRSDNGRWVGFGAINNTGFYASEASLAVSGANQGKMEFEGATIEGFGSLVFSISNLRANLIFKNCTIGNWTGTTSTISENSMAMLKLINSSVTWGTNKAAAFADVSYEKYGQTADDHRIERYHTNTMVFNIQTDATTRNTASDYSWKLQPKHADFDNDAHCVALPLGKVWCEASTAITIGCAGRKDNAGITATLRVRGYQLAGMTDADYTDSVSATDTWESLSVTFTPTEAGFVDVEFIAYGGTTYSAWVDDLTVT